MGWFRWANTINVTTKQSQVELEKLLGFSNLGWQHSGIGEQHLRFGFRQNRILGHFSVHIHELVAWLGYAPACSIVVMTDENELTSHLETEISGSLLAKIQS